MIGTSLRSRIAAGLLGYSVLVGGVIMAVGHLVNERIESLVWRELLTAEFEQFDWNSFNSRDNDPNHKSRLRVYVEREDGGPDDIPVFLRGLSVGIHDEVEVGEDHEYAVMVRMEGSRRMYAVLDIADLEEDELGGVAQAVAVWLGAAAVLSFTVWWLSRRLLSPIERLVRDIDGLSMEGTKSERIMITGAAYDELRSIATALNRLLDRIDNDMARELQFLRTASHELRTPVTIIGGAVELLRKPGLPDEFRPPVERIRQTAAQVEQLIQTLLMLARSPDRLKAESTEFDLAELVDEIVEDHQSLLPAKSLSIRMELEQSSRVTAPIRLAQVAIANLLRNAIENSDVGTIVVRTSLDGHLRIADPGHGMSYDEIGALYSRMARREIGPVARGIGLELILRICEHMKWRLDIESEPGQGTVTTLSFR